MQLMLISGIIFALGAVAFALQNSVAVTVNVALWQLEGSLAMVLLCTLGLGVLITGLLSSPTVIRGQWTRARLRHQVADLEKKLAEQDRRYGELVNERASMTPATSRDELRTADKSYVGLKSLLAGNEVGKQTPD